MILILRLILLLYLDDSSCFTIRGASTLVLNSQLKIRIETAEKTRIGRMADSQQETFYKPVSNVFNIRL